MPLLKPVSSFGLSCAKFAQDYETVLMRIRPVCLFICHHDLRVLSTVFISLHGLGSLFLCALIRRVPHPIISVVPSVFLSVIPAVIFICVELLYFSTATSGRVFE